MRRRVVCPRSHPASPFARRLFGRLRYGSRYFPGGTPPDPPVALCSRLRPHQGSTPGSLRPPTASCLARCAPRVGGRGRVALPSAVPRSPAVRRGPSCGRGGRGGGRLRWPLRPWRRIFASDAVVTPHLRFGTGSGAASPFLTVPWRPTSAPYHPATAGLGHARPWRRPRCRCHWGAASTSRPPVVHFAHTRDAPSTARGDFRRRGYRPWPRKLSRRTCMSTVPGRDVSPRRNPQPAHIP
jgi:hypothetical protein